MSSSSVTPVPAPAKPIPVPPPPPLEPPTFAATAPPIANVQTEAISAALRRTSDAEVMSAPSA